LTSTTSLNLLYGDAGSFGGHAHYQWDPGNRHRPLNSPYHG
jgi:hypothetical protein